MFKKGDLVTPRLDRQGYTTHQHGEKFLVKKVDSFNLYLLVDEGSDLEQVNPANWEIAAGDSVAAETTLGTNPKDLLGIKKVQLNLVPPSSIIYQALAMEDGAAKYGPYNWRQNKVIVSIYIAAAMRHLQSYLDGEELASDSKKPHLGHALACIGIIVDAKETGNLKDDRPLPGPASKLIAEWEQKKKESK